MPTIKDSILDAMQYVKSVGISDIVDMLLIAFLIYKIVGIVRRTDFLRVARGILILAVALWLSALFKLYVVNFILRWVFQMGLVALVIIFQPELRRLLERVGTSRFISLFGSSAQAGGIEAAITQTVLACADMNKSKTGVLILFERETSLDSAMNTGTLLDAETSAELIKSVFFHNAPLHDGALIIKRDARIGAAGCVLPLSASTNLSRDLGMRHRAGIGISEQSDAVVVIVSEETGAISVAVDGMLKRRLSAETLDALLRKELISEVEEGTEGNFRFLANLFRVKK